MGAESAAAVQTAAFDIVAITACNTGVAHTYMAAEALEKSAKAMGLRIKVMTISSGGEKNVLTDADIAAAKAVIIATDGEVPMERFVGKPLILAGISDGINKAEELLKRAPKAAKFDGEHAELATEPKRGGAGRILFFTFVVAGIIAAAAIYYFYYYLK